MRQPVTFHVTETPTTLRSKEGRTFAHWAYGTRALP
jgi:hypothetical protein